MLKRYSDPTFSLVWNPEGGGQSQTIRTNNASARPTANNIRLRARTAHTTAMQTTPVRRVLQCCLSAAVLCSAASIAYHLAMYRPISLAIVVVGLSLLPKVRTLVALIMHTSAAIVLIEVDHILPFPLPFPRTPDELIRKPPRRLLDAAASTWQCKYRQQSRSP